MTFRRKPLWWIGVPIVLAVVLGGLWKIGVIKSLKWVSISCLVCVAIVVIFILVFVFSRKNPHPEDIMGRAHFIEMKKRNSK